MHDSLISRDKLWLESLYSCNHYLKSMYYEQINMGKTMKSIVVRQVKLVKSNLNILD